MSLFDRPILIGSIVHYVMRAEDYLPGATRSGYEHRPAFVMDPPAKGDAALSVNLKVIRAEGDGVPEQPAPPAPAVPHPETLWRGSVVHSAEHTPGTWHWPEEREKA